MKMDFCWLQILRNFQFKANIFFKFFIDIKSESKYKERQKIDIVTMLFLDSSILD